MHVHSTWTETVSHYSRSAACMGYQNPDSLLFPMQNTGYPWQRDQSITFTTCEPDCSQLLPDLAC